MTRPHTIAVIAAAATGAYLTAFSLSLQGQSGATEAPAGFDNRTNGFSTQAQFDLDRATFEERDEIGDGLGPVYNAQSCAECHQNPVTGAGSQVAELRAGHQDVFGNFVDAPGGSLINDRAINAAIQERVPGAENVRTLRMSTSILGTGFIEAIHSNTLVAISNAQPGQSGGAIQGQVIQVPVLEAPNNVRVGRFGWKNQNASLLSFAADAYLNEMGITNKLLNTENTSNGTVVQGGTFDGKGDPTATGEDDAGDINEFTTFMRCLKAPPRGPITSAVTAGQTTFNQIGCAVCHVSTI